MKERLEVSFNTHGVELPVLDKEVLRSGHIGWVARLCGGTTIHGDDEIGILYTLQLDLRINVGSYAYAW